jgi:transposase
MPKRGPELDSGTRAVIAYSSIILRKPLSVIGQEIGVPKSTCKDTRRRALERSKRTKLAVFHEDNQASYYREGRPEVLSLRDKDRLILHGTANKEQRAKTWVTIAFELGLGHISRPVIDRVFHERGYNRCHATHKPHLTEDMKTRRYDWTSDHRHWKVGVREKNDWKNVYFTDETPMALGVQDLIHNITRLPEEKWDNDCCISDFKKPVTLQFFGAIAYDWKGPCHVFCTETEAERAASIALLLAFHKAQYKSDMATYECRLINHAMAKAWNEETAGKVCPMTGKRFKKVKTGRWPAKPPGGPQRSKGGGIDWYRFATEVLEPLVLPDFDELRKKRPGLILMLDGAAAHISANCFPWYEGWEITRLDWPGNSPDLNPIEHIWDLLKKRIKQKYPIIGTMERLKAIWQTEWDLLSLEDINKVIEYQVTAVTRCYKAHGDNAFHG